MTATDELRRMLDERGVEHDDVESAPYPPYNSTRRMTTFWANKCVWQYIEDEREGGDIQLVGRYMSTSVTPEQAIAATVGVDSNTEEAIRKLLDKLSTELCNAGCGVECETREERRRLIDAVKDKYAQAIAATVGADDGRGLSLEECIGAYFSGRKRNG